MTVGLYHVTIPGRPHVAPPALTIASVRRTMPGVQIVQWTTQASMALPGVDAVVIRPELPLALAFVDARSSVEGDWLFLDTDVLVQRDVRSIFDARFDIAVATREGTMRAHEIGSRFMARNLYNAGVVFSRSQAFWLAAWQRAEEMVGRHAWGCDQESINAVIASQKFDVAVLPNTYNYPPFTADEDVRDKAIVHYKGKRKVWMAERAA